MAYGGDALYADLPEGSDPLYATAVQESRAAGDRGNFMDRPDQGWLHDGRGLAAGKGVYFSFPVYYLGSIHMPASLARFSREDQTNITREAIAKVRDAALGPLEQGGRQVSRGVQAFKFGNVQVAKIQVKLSISASGMIIAPIGPEMEGMDAGIINFHPMRVISLASGGEKEYYDFISYVAKDKDTGFRETFVFDTGVFSDDVMSTMGQAFVLAQELAKKGSSAHQGDSTYAQVDEALRMAPGAEQFYADAAQVTGQEDTYFDIAPNGPKAAVEEDTYFDIAPQAPGGGAAGGHELYMDVAPKPQGDSDTYMDVTEALANTFAESESLYDTAAPEATQQLVSALNDNDLYMTTIASTKIAMQRAEDNANDTYMLLAPEDQGEAAAKPQWDAFDEAAVTNRVDIAALRDAQSTYLDINPDL